MCVDSSVGGTSLLKIVSLKMTKMKVLRGITVRNIYRSSNTIYMERLA